MVMPSRRVPYVFDGVPFRTIVGPAQGGPAATLVPLVYRSPGARRTAEKGSRHPELVAPTGRIGRLFNCDSVTLFTSSLFSVLSSEDSALTVTDSVVSPTSSTTSSRIV